MSLAGLVARLVLPVGESEGEFPPFALRPVVIDIVCLFYIIHEHHLQAVFLLCLLYVGITLDTLLDGRQVFTFTSTATSPDAVPPLGKYNGSLVTDGQEIADSLPLCMAPDASRRMDR